MIPFLEGFFASGLTVTEYCEANPDVGQRHCFQGDKLYDQYIQLTPKSQARYDNARILQEIVDKGLHH